MPTTALISAKTAAETSADFTVTSTTPATLTVWTATGDIDGDVQVQIKKKNSSGTYNSANTVAGGGFGSRGQSNNPIVISAPGVYQVIKPLTSRATGVDIDQ
jgi:hypothetical protein